MQAGRANPRARQRKDVLRLLLQKERLAGLRRNGRPARFQCAFVAPQVGARSGISPIARRPRSPVCSSSISMALMSFEQICAMTAASSSRCCAILGFSGVGPISVVKPHSVERPRWIDLTGSILRGRVEKPTFRAARFCPVRAAAGGRSTLLLVGRHMVMMPHLGVVLLLNVWLELAGRLEKAGIAFDIPPVVRFEGEPGEQRTMFFFDPSGNPIEVKGFKSERRDHSGHHSQRAVGIASHCVIYLCGEKAIRAS